MLQGLVVGHPLVDGSKRLGWVAAVVFCLLNDVELNPAGTGAAEDLVVAVASGELSDYTRSRGGFAASARPGRQPCLVGYSASVSDTELVIFDCDGVLVDSERIAVRLEVRLLAELGWELTEAEIAERFLGRTDQYMREQIEAQIGRSLPEDWTERTAARYRDALATELTPVDGIVEALDRIDTQTCVASSGTHSKIRFTLGLTGLYPRFEGRIFSTTEVANGKPAPDLFLYAARQLGVEPAQCVVVEDSHYGVQAARAAGMRALGYAGGLTPAHRLAGPGTTVFTDMRELPELIN